MPNWKKGRRAADHVVDAGKRVKAIDAQLEGLRTDDPRRTALNDQRNAESRRMQHVTVQALRHGVDAAHLADRLDDNGAR
ncbi:hypothetical protein [Cryptosporangium aurantiacum]|uniref:Uncharacterized protein n=1 Tax=Cryptosporangium aurantiacum TaxID=134849 RepID=A0A1M7RQ79_9ACTN|nr:hypothetical protein [Cryptosporangium aurantiacum]SHN48208.1 hypothetical protein SAMN05443668_13626 [Cryptosporangium aurantiacum]